jgi:hypothetical protein
MLSRHGHGRDTLQRLRRVNVALAEQLGATPRDLVGKLCYEVIHGLNYPPDYCPHASVMNERASYHGKTRTVSEAL